MNMNYKITWNLFSWNFFIIDLKNQRHQGDEVIKYKDYKIYRNKSISTNTELAVLMLCFPSNLTRRKCWDLSVFHKRELSLLQVNPKDSQISEMTFSRLHSGSLVFTRKLMVLHLLCITQISGVFQIARSSFSSSFHIDLSKVLVPFCSCVLGQIFPVFSVTGLQQYKVYLQLK